VQDTVWSRGKAWRIDDEFVLVVSCDDWNRRRVSEVLVVAVEEGHAEDAGNYAPLISLDGAPMTVYADDIFGVPRDALIGPAFRLDDEAMRDVDDALDRALSRHRPPRGSSRPAGHPYPGQIRFADLDIPGEGPKPVVVVSSEAYGAELSFALVMACRVTSQPGHMHDYDVPLQSQVGKVVCSDLRTVRAADLLERTTAQASVTPAERAAILTKARRVVGLE